MARKRIKFSFPNLYLISGLLLLSIFFIWKYHQARILSFNTREVAKVNFSGIKPVHIKAYPVGIDVDIKPATIINGVWPVFSETAGLVVNENNTIIYGHNKDNLFGPIRWIKVGSTIEILGDDNKIYLYNVTKIDIVKPNNLEYIKPTVDETLTLYTCTGFLDSQRFIVIAKRIDEKNK
jgi:LPXTG-site transpeptidase (sortase) family protein